MTDCYCFRLISHDQDDKMHFNITGKVLTNAFELYYSQIMIAPQIHKVTMCNIYGYTYLDKQQETNVCVKI